MSLTYVIVLLGTGVVVGFSSGLLGIGGGFIMTPVQFWVYTTMGLPADIAIRIAFGTNLFVFLPTAVSGAWRHYQRGAVWGKAAVILGGCGLIGAYGGAMAAVYIPGSALRIIFGVVVIIGAVRMLTAQPEETVDKAKDSPWLWGIWGLILGFIAGLIGIGGGVLAVPTMVAVFKFKMHQAVGTYTAAMILTSLGGIAGYVVNGIGVTGIPSPHIGYVYIWAWLALAGTSVVTARIGATTAHRLPTRQLRWLFIMVMTYLGLRMIGVFGWLGLPI